MGKGRASGQISLSFEEARPSGEFARDGYYHNAIEVISLMNEPEYSRSPCCQGNFVKAMVSAFDGLLSAEARFGVKPWKNGKLSRSPTKEGLQQGR